MATRATKILLDTNILLDFFDCDRVGHVEAMALMWYTAEQPEECDAYASISSFKDVYYILSRLYKSEAAAREKTEFLLRSVVQPLDLLAVYGEVALGLDEPDFEDALIRAVAEEEGMDAIITRDKKAFGGSLVPSMDASTFLARVGFDYAEVPF